jgi:hypothetical protein
MFPGLLEFIATSAHSTYRPPHCVISRWLQCMARRVGAPSVAGPVSLLAGGAHGYRVLTRAWVASGISAWSVVPEAREPRADSSP